MQVVHKWSYWFLHLFPSSCTSTWDSIKASPRDDLNWHFVRINDIQIELWKLSRKMCGKFGDQLLGLGQFKYHRVNMEKIKDVIMRMIIILPKFSHSLRKYKSRIIHSHHQITFQSLIRRGIDQWLWLEIGKLLLLAWLELITLLLFQMLIEKF